jgi:hypothetical protein
MCVEGGLCVTLSFERSECVIRESAYVVYASSIRDYARDTRWPSVLMRLNWFETAHVHVHPLTPHVHITHEPRTYHVHSTDMRRTKVLVRWTFAKRACLDALRQWFMLRMFVEYCTVFARMRRRARYVSDSSVIRARFMRDLSVISTPDTPKNWSISRRTNPICAWFVIRAWSVVWLALYLENYPEAAR